MLTLNKQMPSGHAVEIFLIFIIMIIIQNVEIGRKNYGIGSKTSHPFKSFIYFSADFLISMVDFLEEHGVMLYLLVSVFSTKL